MRSFILSLVFLTACANLKIARHDAEQAHPKGTPQELKLNSFLFGYVPAKGVPPQSALCPESRMESVQLFMNGTDVLLTVVTLGIYVPYRATISCTK